MRVTIKFRSPPRRNSGGDSIVHERRLEAVPEAIAQQIAGDFQLYRLWGRAAESEVEQYKTYQYKRRGREVNVALDFGEVIVLGISEEEKDTQDDPVTSSDSDPETSRAIS